MDVWVDQYGRTYFVMVDGKQYDSFRLLQGPPLTMSQMIDVAEGYREGLTVS